MIETTSRARLPTRGMMGRSRNHPHHRGRPATFRRMMKL
jgi:hypothetical protein